MTKILAASVILLYFGVGIITGSAIVLLSGKFDIGMAIGGASALIGAGFYAVCLWKWKHTQQVNQHDEIVDIARTALGVNYSSLQTNDPQEVIKARDAIANLIADKVITMKEAK